MPMYQSGGGQITSTAQINDNIVIGAKLSTNAAYIEKFTIDTDSNGQATVTLTRTPDTSTILGTIYNTASRIVDYITNTGTSVTVTIRKTQYQRATSLNTPSSLPAGCYVDSSINGFAVVSGAPSHTSTHGTTGGHNADDDHTHTVGINKLTTHLHTINETTTDMPLAASETGLKLVVVYASSV